MKRIQTAAFGVSEHEMKWEGAYRPRISPKHLRMLGHIKEKTGKPITKIVAEALDHYFENVERG
jgi:predicted DNA-binding protein